MKIENTTTAVQSTENQVIIDGQMSLFDNIDNKLDMVNHPSHYETGKFECIDVMEEVFGKEALKNFCICNAFKYLYRCMNKHSSPVEDVSKARWYINKFLELDGEENE